MGSLGGDVGRTIGILLEASGNVRKRRERREKDGEGREGFKVSGKRVEKYERKGQDDDDYRESRMRVIR